MNYRRGLGNVAILLGATLLFVVAIVALVILVSVLPDVVFLLLGLVAVGVVLYVFVWRRDAGGSDEVRWQF